jgi:hypothetical protein
VDIKSGTSQVAAVTEKYVSKDDYFKDPPAHGGDLPWDQPGTDTVVLPDAAAAPASFPKVIPSASSPGYTAARTFRTNTKRRVPGLLNGNPALTNSGAIEDFYFDAERPDSSPTSAPPPLGMNAYAGSPHPGSGEGKQQFSMQHVGFTDGSVRPLASIRPQPSGDAPVTPRISLIFLKQGS